MHDSSGRGSYGLAALAAAVALLATGLVGAPAEAGARRDAPLVAAVKAADIDTVRALVGDGAVDVNQAEPDGATALHWAVHRNDTALVDLLIAAGADVSAANRYGVQPILARGRERERRDPGSAPRRGGRPERRVAGGRDRADDRRPHRRRRVDSGVARARRRPERPRPLPRPDGADVGRSPEQRKRRARTGRAGGPTSTRGPRAPRARRTGTGSSTHRRPPGSPR